MKITIHLCIVSICFFMTNTFAQISKSNNTIGYYLGASDTRTITFSSADFGGVSNIDNVTITLNFSSIDNGSLGLTFNEDIAFRLESPTGTMVDLIHDARGVFTGNTLQSPTYGGFDVSPDKQIEFDDAASTSIASSPGGNPTSGTFKAEDALSIFNGENPIGNWTLHIADSFNNGFGDEVVFFRIIIHITATTLSIENNELKDQITVILPIASNDLIIRTDTIIQNISIYNIIGEKKIEIINLNQKKTNLSKLSSGIYIVIILTDKGSFTKKIIKS